MDNLHVIGQQVRITPLNESALISFESGINGRMTNSGTQHFEEGELRLFDNQILKMTQTTTESQVDVINYAKHTFNLNNQSINPEQIIFMDRRKIYMKYNDITVENGQTLVLDKISGFYTSRDQEAYSDLDQETLALFRNVADYDTLYAAHTQAWNKLWNFYNIQVTGNDFDQLALRFAIYHLIIMTPAHDNRMSIGAKGLSGEGYKGHAFWDNEIFIVPFYILSNPKIARQLLEYRYLSLDGAAKKATENNYEGAMFPWESAWLSEGEVTPVYGAADIVTGEYTKIWSGFIEQHISADIAYATWQYFQYTHDLDFMQKYGYELIMATAIFWQSRLEWNEELERYEINEIIGPDEYKEHVNNNAFTNYMAYWNIKTALSYYDNLKETQPELIQSIAKRWSIERYSNLWRENLDKIYLPQPNENNVIPQDDTYLTKEIIDLTPYKENEHVGSLFFDYNLAQVNEMQITKQADVLILMYLLEDYFNYNLKKANWDYYEPKTLHDSSLSMSTHSILASDMNDRKLAYKMFEVATKIDLGQTPKSSDTGIHSASLGGVWQSLVFGFAGVRLRHNHLEIAPKLPEAWSSVAFPIYWTNYRLFITVTNDKTTIENLSDQTITAVHSNQQTTISPNIAKTFSNNEKVFISK